MWGMQTHSQRNSSLTSTTAPNMFGFTNSAIIQNVVSSTLNGTVATGASPTGTAQNNNLATGTTWTGTSESTLGVAYIQFEFKSDQSCNIFVDQSIDGTNWDKTDTFLIVSGVGTGKSIAAVGSYYRCRVTNIGPATTTYIRLGTALCPIANDTLRVLGGMGMNKTWPDPANTPSQIYQTGQLDADNNLMVRGSVTSDEGSFADRFPGASLQAALTGTATFKNGLNIVGGSGTLFSTEALAGKYVRLGTDTNANLTQVRQVQGDTSLVLASNYPGANGSGAAVVSNWLQSVSGTGTAITVAASACTIASGTSNGALGYIFRSVDYPVLHLITRFSLSARIANQTTIVGFQDAPTAATSQSYFSFTGTDNTQVSCVTVASSGEILTQTVTLPGGSTTAAYQTYEIRLTQKKVAFYINRVLVAVQTTVVVDPYSRYGVYFGISNQAAVASTNFIIDSVAVLNESSMDVECSQADASKFNTTAYGQYVPTLVSLTSGQISPLQLSATGSLRVAVQENSDKATYVAATPAFTIGTTPTDIFTVFGSATKTVKITKVTVSQSQTAAGPETFLLYKRTAADTGGTRNACVVVPHDSAYAAGTAPVGYYTGATAPTVNGTTTLLLYSFRGSVGQYTGTSTGGTVPVILFEATRPAQAIVLRGTAEGIAINGTAAGNICCCTVEFTEE